MRALKENSTQTLSDRRPFHPKQADKPLPGKHQPSGINPTPPPRTKQCPKSATRKFLRQRDAPASIPTPPAPPATDIPKIRTGGAGPPIKFHPSAQPLKKN